MSEGNCTAAQQDADRGGLEGSSYVRCAGSVRAAQFDIFLSNSVWAVV